MLPSISPWWWHPCYVQLICVMCIFFIKLLFGVVVAEERENRESVYTVVLYRPEWNVHRHLAEVSRKFLQNPTKLLSCTFGLNWESCKNTICRIVFSFQLTLFQLIPQICFHIYWHILFPQEMRKIYLVHMIFSTILFIESIVMNLICQRISGQIFGEILSCVRYAEGSLNSLSFFSGLNLSFCTLLWST